MAGSIRKTDISVIERLGREPHRFHFYQAVRLLLSRTTIQDQDALPSSKKRTGQIGTVSSISEEPLRFRMQPALSFAPSEVISIQPHQSRRSPAQGTIQDSDPLLDIEVGFWGLTGPAGALPNHYTQAVIDRVHAKDHAMRDFFDMFSHRQLSFFYRAWEKYFLAAGVERSARLDRPQADLVRESLLSLVGRGTKHVRGRLECADDACIYYGGLFADRPTAESLREMVSDYLGLPAKVLSMFGQWLVLPPTERSRLGELGGHCQMGSDVILGGRTWDPSSKFRIRIGPVKWPEFQDLMPTGTTLVRICQFIRSYVGLEFDFDLQVILLASEIPSCRLSHDGDQGDVQDSLHSDDPVQPYLGWNTWLCSKTPQHDSEDAVFCHDGSPTR